MFHPTTFDGAIIQKTCTFHGVQRGSLITDLLTLEDPFLEEQHNLPQIKDFPTFHDIEHHDLQQTNNINNLVELVWREILNTSTEIPTL
jgi:hypothetical protein